MTLTQLRYQRLQCATPQAFHIKLQRSKSFLQKRFNSWKPSLHTIKCQITSHIWFLEYLNKLKPFSPRGGDAGDRRLTLTMVLTYSDSTAQ